MFGNKGIRKSSIYIFLALILPLCIVAITICFISLNKRNKQNAPAVDGKSAYEMAVDAGFSGTEKEWLDSLKGTSGTKGLNAYEIAQRESGFTGTVEEFLASLVGVDGDKGDNGKNAYEEAKANGFLGTEEEFIEMLNLAIEKNAKGETGEKGDIGVSVTNVDASYELGNDGYTYLYLHYEFSNGSEIDKISKIGKKIEDFIDVYPSVIPYGSSNNPFFIDVEYQDGTTGTILLEKENFSRYNEYNTLDNDYSTYIDYIVDGKDNENNIQLFNRDSNYPYKYVTNVEFDANNFIFIPFLSGEYNENSDIGIDLNLYGTIHYNDGTSEYRYLKEGYNKNSEDRYTYDYHFRPNGNAYRSNYEKIWNKETETFDTRDYNYNAHYYVMNLDNSYQYKYQYAERRNDYIYKGSRNSSKYVVFYDPDYIDVVENRICPKPDAINRLKNRNQMYQISDNGSWTYFYAYDNKYPLTLSDLAAYDYNLRALFLDNFCIQTTYTDGHITYEDIPESLISSCSTNAKSVNSTYTVYFNKTIQGVNANRDYYYSSYQKPMDTFDSLEFEIVSVEDLTLKPGELFTPPYRSKYKNISFSSYKYYIYDIYNYNSYFTFDNAYTNKKESSNMVYVYRNNDGSYSMPEFMSNASMHLYLEYYFTKNNYNNYKYITETVLSYDDILNIVDFDEYYEEGKYNVYKINDIFIEIDDIKYNIGNYFTFVILDDNSTYGTVDSGAISLHQGVELIDGIPHILMYNYIGFDLHEKMYSEEDVILERKFYYLDEIIKTNPEWIRTKDFNDIESNEPMVIFYKFDTMDEIGFTVCIPYFVNGNTAVAGFDYERDEINLKAKVGDTFDDFITNEVRKLPITYYTVQDFEYDNYYYQKYHRVIYPQYSWVDLSNVENTDQVFTTPGKYTFTINIGNSGYSINVSMEVIEPITKEDKLLGSYYFDESSKIINMFDYYEEELLKINLYDNGYSEMILTYYNSSKDAYELNKRDICKYEFKDNILKIDFFYYDSYFKIDAGKLVPVDFEGENVLYSQEYDPMPKIYAYDDGHIAYYNIDGHIKGIFALKYDIKDYICYYRYGLFIKEAHYYDLDGVLQDILFVRIGIDD